MSAPKIVSERQVEILLAFMEDNRGFAVGMVGNSTVEKQQMARRWEGLATSLNSAGAAKSGNKWRDYWSEKKYEVRRKAAEVRGTGASAGAAMTPTEKRILRILAKSTQPVISSQEVSSTTDDPTPYEARRHVCNAAHHQFGHHCPDTSLSE